MGRLVLFCGPPGAGKTTLAERLAGRLREGGYAPTVLHSDDFSRNTYDQLAERAAAALDGGDEPVVVDGTFYEREWRERFRALDSPFVVLVTADLDTCLRRNWEREESIDEAGVRTIHRALETDPPDADFTVETDVLPIGTAVDLVVRRVEEYLEN